MIELGIFMLIKDLVYTERSLIKALLSPTLHFIERGEKKKPYLTKHKNYL